MNRRLMGFAGAAVLAVIGAFAILVYVRDADDRAQSDLELVEVYMVEDRVAAGADESQIRDALTVELVQANTVVPGGVADLAQLDGTVAAVDLVAGEQLLLARLIDAASFDDGRTRLTAVPDGMHEVTFSLSPERAVGGQITPGDTLAFIATLGEGKITGAGFDDQSGQVIVPTDAGLDSGISQQSLTIPSRTHILLHKVLVTRVQVEQLPRELTDADGNPVDSTTLAPTGNLLITLALEAPDVERTVYVAEHGTIWLSYEPEDAGEDGTRLQDGGSVFVDEWPELLPVSQDVAS
jgi:pilus assembly protein CpaB